MIPDREPPAEQQAILQPVILCGGSGTRLWPLSREQYPKQLLALTGGDTLLQATARRLAMDSVRRPIVVGNEDYRFITAEQLRQAEIEPAMLVLEPCGRNTAPALTLAALCMQEADPVLVVMPADHVISDLPAFRNAIEHGARYAASGKVVAFGIQPTHAETGYGYIRAPEAIEGGGRVIAAFVEKPDATTAQEYLASGDYLWNAGIFMVRASVWMALLRASRPDIAEACESAYADRTVDRDFLRVHREHFTACPNDSIDYAVMERLGSGEGIVVTMSAGWSDVGAWDAFWQINAKDAQGNVLQGDVIALETRNTLAISQSRLVACIGLQDTIVVETPDAVLVAHKPHIQRVKEIVAHLKLGGRSEASAHRKIHRPWGYYDSIDAGERFQVKRIVVKPQASLSLQMHHHRAEHWIVVRGTARVTRGEETFLVSENQSTYIPLGIKHRLENPGKVNLELIEVQSGAYLGEDDIERFEDSYGRISEKAS